MPESKTPVTRNRRQTTRNLDDTQQRRTVTKQPISSLLKKKKAVGQTTPLKRSATPKTTRRLTRPRVTRKLVDRQPPLHTAVLIVILLLATGLFFYWQSATSQPNPSAASDNIRTVEGTWNVPCVQSMQFPSGDYSVIGGPTVTVEFIHKVLTYYHSPAVEAAQHLYDSSVRCGIDPAFTLAFFMHESSLGRAGMATVTLSPGNLRCIKEFVCHKGYAKFSSWEEGFTVFCRLIRNLYVNSWQLITVDQIIPRYAPRSDNNDEGAYIRSVKTLVDRARAGEVDIANSNLQP